MTTAYRDQALRCPACAAWLEPSPAGEETIDVCPGCGAIWVDWFDGDLPTLLRDAARPARPGDGRGGLGERTCPRCAAPLSEERYLGTAAKVLRCGHCSGALVPRASLAALAAIDPAEEPEAPTWLARLIALIRRRLGAG